MYMHMYIYIYICVCVYVYIYIYIYTHIGRRLRRSALAEEGGNRAALAGGQLVAEKGDRREPNGDGINGRGRFIQFHVAATTFFASYRCTDTSFGLILPPPFCERLCCSLRCVLHSSDGITSLMTALAFEIGGHSASNLLSVSRIFGGLKVPGVWICFFPIELWEAGCVCEELPEQQLSSPHAGPCVKAMCLAAEARSRTARGVCLSWGKVAGKPRRAKASSIAFQSPLELPTVVDRPLACPRDVLGLNTRFRRDLMDRGPLTRGASRQSLQTACGDSPCWNNM